MKAFIRIIFLLSPALLLYFVGNAQKPSSGTIIKNLRHATFPLQGDSILLDTLSIIPHSVQVLNVAADTYRIDEINAILIWIKKPEQETVEIVYRVFPVKLNSIANHLNYDSLDKYYIDVPYGFDEPMPSEEKGTFNFGNIQASGSIGRQIGFGNNQDAVVNSTLYLQLSGMLGDSIEIAAALTDNNIPVQPDGTTQQLNEFDQVFIQFKKKNWQLNLGDLDIRQNKSYFLNFYKRLQGIAFQTKNKIGKKISSETLVSGSIAKGKFTRNVFQGLEGNQGPYKLIGANNEFYFIVLPNTERVFVDGVLLQRGEDQEYVINYNTAEVSFTQKKMITKDSRIQIEFEYAERSYLNTNLYLSQELGIGEKLKLRIGVFNNSDAKNSQINQILDNSQRHFLSQVGDSIQQAFYPSAVIDSFSTDKILYEKIFIGADSIYQYSTDPNTAKYHLAFISVQEGKGNYVPDFNGANGKVYKYVAPISGIKQGSYEPVIVLVTPKKQQLVNLGVDYTISKSTQLTTEFAMSNYDVNTFSKIGNGDDNGFAAKIQLKNQKQFTGKKAMQLETLLDYEYVQDKFKPLERLRNVEFSRDWGLSLTTIPVTENIIKLNAALKNKLKNTLSYSFINYRRGAEYNGVQNALKQFAILKGWTFNNEFTLTNFNASLDKGIFLRPIIDLSKEFTKWDKWKMGFRYELEKNKAIHKATDTLTPNAFSFDQYTVYLQSDENKPNRYSIRFFTRSDQYSVGKNFVRGDRSYNLNLNTELLANTDRKFYLNTTFRKLKVYDSVVSSQQEDATVLGRAMYVFSEWKNVVSGDILYEVGAGQEQRRDFSYIEVPAGTGDYAWIDYNNDGIQQLNEFELAAFQDQRKFVQIFTPTNEYIKANYVTFNYGLTITPKSLLNKPGLRGIKNILSRLLINSGLQVSKKTVSSGNFEFNPFSTDIKDAALINLATTFQNTISYNRFDNIWGIDLNNIRGKSRSLLTYGYETRVQNQWTTKLRWNIGSKLGFLINGQKKLQALYTPAFDNRNYELSIYSLEPTLSYVRGVNFRIATSYKFERKTNAADYGGEKSTSNIMAIESKYVLLQNSALMAKFTYNTIHYPHSPSTTVSYIMLDGLQPGKNLLWTFNITKRLLNNLELRIEYDGRKAGDSRTVHIGRAAITALF